MRKIPRTLLLVGATIVPTVAAAQTPRSGDVTVSLGADRVFRAEDRSFGTVASPGVGAELRVLPQFGVGFDIHRATGLDVIPQECTPPAGVPCTGNGRDGVIEATTTSVTGAWYAGGNSRVQPYVIGGMAAVRARIVSSLTVARAEGWTVSERQERDTGFGITGGIGLRLLVADRIVIRPEWRLSSGSILGRANLGVMRTSVAVGYAW